MVKSEEEWLDDLLYREDVLYSNRINFFILAQTMLLFSYITSIYALRDIGNFFAILIGILALFVTGFFIMIFHRTVDYIRYLRRQLEWASSSYKRIWRGKKNKAGEKITGTNILVGEGIAICFFTVWLFLLFFSLPIEFCTILSLAYFLFFVSLLTYSLCQILKDSHF